MILTSCWKYTKPCASDAGISNCALIFVVLKLVVMGTGTYSGPWFKRALLNFSLCSQDAVLSVEIMGPRHDSSANWCFSRVGLKLFQKVALGLSLSVLFESTREENDIYCMVLYSIQQLNSYNTWSCLIYILSFKGVYLYLRSGTSFIPGVFWKLRKLVLLIGISLYFEILRDSQHSLRDEIKPRLRKDKYNYF